MDHFRISDFTDENKPRERMNVVGAAALSDQELLAILLRSGTREMNVIELSQTILKHCGGLNGLRRITAEELQEISGIGPAKTASILASVELGRRFSKAIRKNEDRLRINTAEDVYEFLRYDMESLDHEELRVLSLDSKHYLIGEDILYKGTINTSNIRIAEVFRRPLMLNAACMIMAHNHPSGDPTPSAADIVTTRNIIAAGKSLELPLMDHVIIGQGCYTSVKNYLE
ncbi:MAG: DNA repair protein RadC [Lachnospiraceae bacterium]|nr:DNA repair protein RadC [Lachnospiraceae bacterium]